MNVITSLFYIIPFEKISELTVSILFLFGFILPSMFGMTSTEVSENDIINIDVNIERTSNVREITQPAIVVGPGPTYYEQTWESEFTYMTQINSKIGGTVGSKIVATVEAELGMTNEQIISKKNTQKITRSIESDSCMQISEWATFETKNGTAMSKFADGSIESSLWDSIELISTEIRTDQVECKDYQK